uniref:MULE transposase domain-containing protein n=1 Tax=Cannabis sativa TaxID=3483 RepID=A0A803P4D2_CANSA
MIYGCCCPYLAARNNSEANVYLVLPDPQVALEWEEDAEAVKMQQPEQSSKVEKCKIEELPEGCTVVPDVVVNPLGHVNVEDKFYNFFVKWQPDGPKSPNVVVIGFKEPLEETSTDKRLRLRRMRKAQPQTQAPDSRDELHRVHIDDEDGDHTSKLEFNPQTKNDDFKFELNIEFGSIKILRAALKEHFIHIDREYILIHNDKWFYRGCRPLIGLDGCFLKGYCKGVLLAALGVDGGNSIFLIAYAVVEKETTSSWEWFLTLLKDDLAPRDTSTLTMMSDRQKGLQNVVESTFNSPDTRFYVSHMYCNFKKDFPGLLSKQLV